MEKRAVFGVVRFWCQYLMYGPRHFSYNARLHHERRRRRSRVHDVSREKVFNRRRRLLGRVFVHGVSRLRKQRELKLPLHLRNREFGVQSIVSGENQQFRRANGEKFSR